MDTPLAALHSGLERGRIDAGNLALRGEIDPRDREPVFHFIELHPRRGVDARWRMARFGEHVGERHGETAGVRRGDYPALRGPGVARA